MRTIGMLGGMSWESTIEYYRLANRLVREELGGLHSARILLDSVDFEEVAALQRTDQWDRAGELLAAKALALQNAGADMLLICTNTMHKVADDIAARIDIPILHIADVVADAVRAAGISRVGLLGTAFTMEQDFYRERLLQNGVEAIVPDEEDRATVHRVIFDELVQGVVTDESRKAFSEIIGRLEARGATGVVLGCTEIELLIGCDDCDVKVFPTTKLHVEAAIAAALEPARAQ